MEKLCINEEKSLLGLVPGMKNKITYYISPEYNFQFLGPSPSPPPQAFLEPAPLPVAPVLAPAPVVPVPEPVAHSLPPLPVGPVYQPDEYYEEVSTTCQD